MERKYKEEAIDYLQQTVTLISKGNYEKARACFPQFIPPPIEDGGFLAHAQLKKER